MGPWSIPNGSIAYNKPLHAETSHMNKTVDWDHAPQCPALAVYNCISISDKVSNCLLAKWYACFVGCPPTVKVLLFHFPLMCMCKASEIRSSCKASH